MPDEQYEKLSKMLHHLEEGARIASELAEKGANPIGPEDWADQIAICNGVIAGDHVELTDRAKALIATLERLKP